MRISRGSPLTFIVQVQLLVVAEGATSQFRHFQLWVHLLRWALAWPEHVKSGTSGKFRPASRRRPRQNFPSTLASTPIRDYFAFRNGH